tara:strand:- start:369 stop:593 length:225 start_codon:yes stop_codon:yes gene_type:complete
MVDGKMEVVKHIIEIKLMLSLVKLFTILMGTKRTIVGLILDLLVKLSIIKTTLKKVVTENAKVATFGVVKLNHA